MYIILRTCILTLASWIEPYVGVQTDISTPTSVWTFTSVPIQSNRVVSRGSVLAMMIPIDVFHNFIHVH